MNIPIIRHISGHEFLNFIFTFCWQTCFGWQFSLTRKNIKEYKPIFARTANTLYQYSSSNWCIGQQVIHPRSVAVNHAGLWIRRHQFESGRGYPDKRWESYSNSFSHAPSLFWYMSAPTLSQSEFFSTVKPEYSNNVIASGLASGLLTSDDASLIRSKLRSSRYSSRQLNARTRSNHAVRRDVDR